MRRERAWRVQLTIWGRANSVNVQKVLWCLAELDISYQRIDAGMAVRQERHSWNISR